MSLGLPCVVPISESLGDSSYGSSWIIGGGGDFEMAQLCPSTRFKSLSDFPLYSKGTSSTHSPAEKDWRNSGLKWKTLTQRPADSRSSIINVCSLSLERQDLVSKTSLQQISQTPFISILWIQRSHYLQKESFLQSL